MVPNIPYSFQIAAEEPLHPAVLIKIRRDDLIKLFGGPVQDLIGKLNGIKKSPFV